MFGVPVEAFHRLIDGHARMQVKVAGLVPMVDARGTRWIVRRRDGRLVNFESDDRSRSSPGGTPTKARFSTPLRDYRDFGPLHLAGYGEARWRLPEGEFTYGEFTMVDVATNVR